MHRPGVEPGARPKFVANATSMMGRPNVTVTPSMLLKMYQQTRDNHVAKDITVGFLSENPSKQRPWLQVLGDSRWDGTV